jgi:hypothetical protein
MNSTSLIEWLSENKNLNTISVIQQGISLLIGLAIFIKSYDFESMLSSVQAKRERSRKEKERLKLLKFQKLLNLSKQSGTIDIASMLDEKTTDNESSEEKKPESIMRTTRKKRRVVESV